MAGVLQINWSLCIFCQDGPAEGLECPAKSKKGDCGKGYSTLATNLKEFHDAGALPDSMNLESFKVETLIENKASWHKSCRVKFSSTKLQRILKRKHDSDQLSDQPGPSTMKMTRSIKKDDVQSMKQCFFCDADIEASDPYRRVAATLEIDKKVRRCATDMVDTRLLTKLAGGDMVAIEAEYHANCLTVLYKKHSKFVKTSYESQGYGEIHGTVFAELCLYIEESRFDEEKKIFKLADLLRLYNKRLQELGVEGEYIHASRLKNKLLSQIPDLSAYTSKHSQGQGIYFMFDYDVAELVQEASLQKDYDMDAIYIARAAEIVRRDMFQKGAGFSGSFERNCQENSVPNSLKTLVDMVLLGPSIENQSKNVEQKTRQTSLTVSQLIYFNSIRHRKAAGEQSRHNIDRETPLPLYIGLKLYASTRKKDLVDIMFELGMCISYDRVLQLATDLGNGVCERFEAENVVCPVNLKQGLFTAGALDNCDHNPSSTTAQDSFHGTSVSLFQFPTNEVPGDDRGIVAIDANSPREGRKKILPLLESYTNVPPAAIHTKTFFVPETGLNVVPGDACFLDAMTEEVAWLQQVDQAVHKDSLDNNEFISWAAYHASQKPQVPEPVSIGALLPLFYENAHTVAMIKHGMNVIKKAIHHVNPEQIPVMAVDQPLYSLAKQVQWTWPDEFGEDKYLIMFGGLHIEMAAFRALGTLLQDSGWVQAVVQAEYTRVIGIKGQVNLQSIPRNKTTLSIACQWRA